VVATLADGQSAQVKGSGSALYTLKNSGGVFSCTCPAWMHQDLGIERRTCKHLRAYLGDEAEAARLGAAALTGRPVKARRAPAPGEEAVDDAAAEGPALLLAHKWSTDVDLTGWWLSEKLDGVRAYWDGTQFISRLGNKFFAPAWFTERFPATPLDGELWGGRQLFQRTVGIVKRQDASPLWKELRFMVFDAPAHGGLFEERLRFVDATLQALGIDWLQTHPHLPCQGTQHLRDELARVEALGGEGLMLRQPASRYEAGRSNTLVKVKSFHDAEARVLAHVPGAGRHKGRLGALLVELENGTQFSVGSGFSDAERNHPPALGAVITFRYQELSNTGVPRFPTYVGERIDAHFHSTATPGSAVRRVRAPQVDVGGDVLVSKSKSPAPDLAMAAATSASPITAGALVSGPPTVPAASATGTRRLEFVEGVSAKFWEIHVAGACFHTRYGKIGTDGQRTRKDFATDAKAQAEADKLLAEKIKKGYIEK
jgi:DNA ligase-1